MSNKALKQYLLIGLGVLIVVLLVVGLRVVLTSGQARVTLVGEPGMTVYTGVDSSDTHTIPNRGSLTLRLEAGEHGFIATQGEGYYPWAKSLALSEGEEITLYPFSLSQNPTFEEVTSEDERYAQIESSFVPEGVPTSEEPLLSQSGNLELRREGDLLVAEWLGETEDMPEWVCGSEPTEECRVFPVLDIAALQASAESEGATGTTGTLVDADLSDVSFFGSREELVLFSNSNGVYVIELDRRDQQNFQPYYLGGLNPRFMVRDQDVIVQDQGGFYILQR